MENNSSETLYQASINYDSTVFIKPNKIKTICCCISQKWCFEHSGIAGFKYYDENKNNCCTCLDCCSWCLEFRFKKMPIFSKEMSCYMCCCAIYFD